MIAFTEQAELLAVWICFTVVALVGIIAIFVWAVRARQFSDQDRARHLPLRSNIPPQEGNGGDGKEAEEKQGRGKHASV